MEKPTNVNVFFFNCTFIETIVPSTDSRTIYRFLTFGLERCADNRAILPLLLLSSPKYLQLRELF